MVFHIVVISLLKRDLCVTCTLLTKITIGTSNQITTVRTKTCKNTLLTKTYIQSTKIWNLQKILNVISALLTKWFTSCKDLKDLDQ